MRCFGLRENIFNNNILSKTIIVEINISYVLYITVLKDESQLNRLPQCYKNVILTHFFFPILLNRTKQMEVLSVRG